MSPSLRSSCPRLSRWTRRALTLGCAGLMVTAGVTLPGQLSKQNTAAHGALVPAPQHSAPAGTSAPLPDTDYPVSLLTAQPTSSPSATESSAPASQPATPSTPPTTASTPAGARSASTPAPAAAGQSSGSAPAQPGSGGATPATVDPQRPTQHSPQANARPAKAKTKAKPKTKAKAKPKAQPKASAKPKTSAKPKAKAKPKAATPAVVVAATGTERSYANSILSMLNSERAAHKLSALRMNANLINSARFHNLNMARANTMSHQLSGEPNFADRIQNAGYNWVWAGENVGWNSDMSLAGVQLLESMMYNEKPPNDGHRQNILSKHFTEVGIDVYLDNAHHKVWITEDFGSRS